MKTTYQMYLKNEIKRLQNKMDKLAEQYPLAMLDETKKSISDEIDTIFEEIEYLKEDLQ